MLYLTFEMEVEHGLYTSQTLKMNRWETMSIPHPNSVVDSHSVFSEYWPMMSFEIAVCLSMSKSTMAGFLYIGLQLTLPGRIMNKRTAPPGTGLRKIHGPPSLPGASAPFRSTPPTAPAPATAAHAGHGRSTRLRSVRGCPVHHLDARLGGDLPPAAVVPGANEAATARSIQGCCLMPIGCPGGNGHRRIETSLR